MTIILILCILIFLVIGIGNDRTQSPNGDATVGLAPLTQQSTLLDAESQTIVLVLGVDQGQGRADSNIVVLLDHQKKRLTMVSVLRDTYVEIPGHGWDKLAHAYAFGGPPLAKETVSSLLDIPIGYFVSVDFSDFVKVVDSVGGVDIEVQQPMHYDDDIEGLHIHFDAGKYHMDGKTALKYARYRSDSDIYRANRQQEVVRAVLNKASQPDTVRRIPALVTSISAAIETDLSLSRIIDLVPVGAKVADQRTFETVVLNMGRDEWMNPSEIAPNGVYYFVPDMVEIRTRAYRVFFGREPPADFLDRARQMQEQVMKAVNSQKDMDARR